MVESARTPQHRAQPREQLLERERLHDVVVGAEVEAANPIAERIARSHDDGGRRRRPFVHHAQQLQAIAIGKPEIENHGPQRHHFDHAPRAFARARHDRGIASQRELRLERLGDCAVILDDQNLHDVALGVRGLKVTPPRLAMHDETWPT